MERKLALILVAVGLLSGCTTYSKFSSTGAGLLAWDNDVSAGLVVPGGTTTVVDPSGTRTITTTPPKACMQWALAMKDVDNTTNVNISDAALQLISKVPNNADSGDLVNIYNALGVTSKAINVSTERTAFLMIGAFYLCQLQANGLSSQDTVTRFDHLVTVAGGLRDPNPSDVQVGMAAPGQPVAPPVGPPPPVVPPVAAPLPPAQPVLDEDEERG